MSELDRQRVEFLAITLRPKRPTYRTMRAAVLAASAAVSTAVLSWLIL